RRARARLAFRDGPTDGEWPIFDRLAVHALGAQRRTAAARIADSDRLAAHLDRDRLHAAPALRRDLERVAAVAQRLRAQLVPARLEHGRGRAPLLVDARRLDRRGQALAVDDGAQ